MITEEAVNRLLFKYDNDKHFGVAEFAASLRLLSTAVTVEEAETQRDLRFEAWKKFADSFSGVRRSPDGTETPISAEEHIGAFYIAFDQGWQLRGEQATSSAVVHLSGVELHPCGLPGHIHN